MLFNSLTFLLFFVAVLAAYRLLPSWNQRKLLLLIASWVFYAAWYPPYLCILLFSTVLDWWIARRIDACQLDSRRKQLLVISLACNLGLLGFFKYGGFLLDNLQHALAIIGISSNMPAWNIVLPIGISFYTFASLSYTIDVYRREVHADCSLSDYALFVSFFPHLVAGPIVRAKILLPQIAQPRHVTAAQLAWGLSLTCFGLFAKTVLADSIFAPLVEQVYADPGAYSAHDIWAAVFGFSGQIYFDFCGYSLCAIGLALCFGFGFPDNFRYPYAARGFSDFWRRWHITLSSWLRDYLYIPLGGNTHGERKTYRNLMLTMLLGGLWHGASWMFVIWGGLHGIYLAIERRVMPRPLRQSAYGVVSTIGVFLLVTLTWIPFRSPDAHTAANILTGLVRAGAPRHLDPLAAITCFTTIAATFVWQFLQRDASLEQTFSKLGDGTRVLVLAFCLIAIFLCSGGDERAFIYFQF